MKLTPERAAKLVWMEVPPLERESISIQTLLGRYWDIIPCEVCTFYGPCKHRDRVEDLALIGISGAVSALVKRRVKERVWGQIQ